VLPQLEVAVTVTSKKPAARMVPEITPVVGSIVRAGGNPVAEKVNGDELWKESATENDTTCPTVKFRFSISVEVGGVHVAVVQRFVFTFNRVDSITSFSEFRAIRV